MKKITYIISVAVLLLIILAAVFFINSKNSNNNTIVNGLNEYPDINTSYLIDGEVFDFVNGKSEKIVDNDKNTLSFFGEPVYGDVNNDGSDDAVVMFTLSNSGSGIFYYVAVVINNTDINTGTNAIFIGDRIAPQNIEIRDDRIIVNYVDRKLDEPMTAQPSVGVSTYLYLDGNLLKKVTDTNPEISYLISEEDTTEYCNGVDMNSDDYRKTINVKKYITSTEANPTNDQIIKEVVNASTSGMCNNVMNQLDITEDNGTVYIPIFEGWAGVSITMCSCKPQVEVNLLQIPYIKKVVWASDSDKADLIRLDYPTSEESISSPLIIKGEARGYWFFEASFPVILTDLDGEIIAQGFAEAKDDWMTDEFVPFEASLEFTIDEDTDIDKGLLILKKDNPSGLPENDDSFEVSVTFSE